MVFKAAVIQLNTPNRVGLARNHIAPFIEQAARAGAKFISTPEGSNLLERDPHLFKENCPSLETQDDINFYSNLARDNSIYLLIGSAVFRQNNKKAVNRSLFFNSNGDLIAYYDKIHLFDVNLGNGMELMESRNYEAGMQAKLIKTPLGIFGLSICYDVRFAHLYRGLCQGGAQILTIPAAFTVPTGRAHWEVLLRARAIENGAFVFAPAQVGKHLDGRETYGHSMIINPWGEVIAKLNGEETGFAMAEINLDEVIEARRKIPAWNLNKDFEQP